MRHRSHISRDDSALAILFLVWGVSVVMFSVAGRFYAMLPHSYHALGCPFKQVTGIPCATCGTTRTFVLMGKGMFVEAMKMNPFVFFTSLIGLGLGVSALGAYAGLWRFPGFQFLDRHRRISAAVLVTLFLANWLYLIWTGA